MRKITIQDACGTLLISDAYKRWHNEATNENKLVKLLKENKFIIIKNIENKFMFIEARKN